MIYSLSVPQNHKNRRSSLDTESRRAFFKGVEKHLLQRGKAFQLAGLHLPERNHLISPVNPKGTVLLSILHLDIPPLSVWMCLDDGIILSLRRSENHRRIRKIDLPISIFPAE
jgi:hypothetical protein